MIIKFNDATVGYGKNKVIEHLNIEIGGNDSVCLLGRNGIGKTTIFKALLGFIDVLEGEILVDDVPIHKMNAKTRARCFSYVPQAKSFSYQFTVEEIIMMGRALHIRQFSEPSADDFKRVDEVLKLLEIEDKRFSKYSELSGGEQQIVLIARAIAQDSKFIIMDEPSSNLDFSNQKKLMTVINILRKLDIGILMSTHNPEHAFLCCDYALLIYKDKTYNFGNVNDVVTEVNLKQAYDVDIGVISTDKNNTCYLKFN